MPEINNTKKNMALINISEEISVVIITKSIDKMHPLPKILHLFSSLLFFGL
jgi:hypothetical protein